MRRRTIGRGAGLGPALVAMTAACEVSLDYVLPADVESALVLRGPESATREVWALDRGRYAGPHRFEDDGASSDWDALAIAFYDAPIASLGLTVASDGRVALGGVEDGWPLPPASRGAIYAGEAFVLSGSLAERLDELRLAPPPCPTLEPVRDVQLPDGITPSNVVRVAEGRLMVAVYDEHDTWGLWVDGDRTREIDGSRRRQPYAITPIEGPAPIRVLIHSRDHALHALSDSGVLGEGRAITGLEGQILIEHALRPRDGALFVRTSSGAIARLDEAALRWDVWGDVGPLASLDHCSAQRHQTLWAEDDGSVVVGVDGAGLVRVTPGRIVRLHPGDPADPGRACATQYLTMETGPSLSWRSDGGPLQIEPPVLRWRPGPDAPWTEGTGPVTALPRQRLRGPGGLAVTSGRRTQDLQLLVHDPRRPEQQPRVCGRVVDLTDGHRYVGWDGDRVVVSGTRVTREGRIALLRWLEIVPPPE